MFTRRVPRDHAERGKHSARGADVVSRTGAAPGNESQARRISRRPLPGRAVIGALTVENGQGNVASDLPRFLHIDANRTSICVSVTPSVSVHSHRSRGSALKHNLIQIKFVRLLNRKKTEVRANLRDMY